MNERRIIRKNEELVLVENDNNHDLYKSPFIIGRDINNCDLCIENSTISRTHVKLTKIRNKWLIEDLESGCGTFLNGEKLDSSKKYQISPNDCIELSDYKIEVQIKNPSQPQTKVDSENKRLEESVEENTSGGLISEENKHWESTKIMTEIDEIEEKNEGDVSGIEELKEELPVITTSKFENLKQMSMDFLETNAINNDGVHAFGNLLKNFYKIKPDPSFDIENFIKDYEIGIENKRVVSKTVEENFRMRAPEEEEESEINKRRIIRRPTKNNQEIEDKIEKISMPLNPYDPIPKVNDTKVVEELIDLAHYRGLVFYPILIDGDRVAIPVIKTPFIIGKSGAHSDFELNARGISRAHCLISFRNSTYFISDLASTNGVTVNKKRIKANKEIRVKNGDKINLGINQFYIKIQK